MTAKVHYKTLEEIERIRESCLLVSKVLAHIGSILKPGITGIKIDKIAEEFILDHKAKPAFKGYKGFPGTLCVSVNEEVVHGIPSKQAFEDGDVISIDCGVYLNEFFGDSAYSFGLGNVEKEVVSLMKVTRASLYKGIEKATVGSRVGDISHAVQEYAEKQHAYGVVRELVGHGIGRNLHEPPEIPNYGKRGKGAKLKDGLVIAIEPMVNLGTRKVRTAKDGWTIFTDDRKPSAHYEHTIAVRKTGVDILTTHEFIEEAIKNNEELIEI